MWEKHHGPKPEGCDVHHRDENKENDLIENLELMKGKEHDDYHSFQKFSRDVDEIINWNDGEDIPERVYE